VKRFSSKVKKLKTMKLTDHPGVSSSLLTFLNADSQSDDDPFDGESDYDIDSSSQSHQTNKKRKKAIGQYST